MSKIDELIQELCPDGVEYRQFNEVCSLHARIGWQRLTKNEQMIDGQYMLITGTDFTSSHNLDYDTCVYVDKKRYDQDPHIQVQNGDVLITKDGTLGKVAFVRNLPLPATLNGGVFVVRDISGHLAQRFIMYYLLSNTFRFAVASQHTGSTIQHLTQGLFSKLIIPVPPLAVQAEIVRVLDSFTSLEAELEAELEARKKQYEYYRNQILGHAASSAQLLKLTEIGEIVTGRTPRSSDVQAWGQEVDFITPSDIANGMKVVSNPQRMLSAKAAAAYTKTRVPAQSILVTCIGADMGKTVINAHECITNQQINSIVLNNTVDINYIFHILTAMRSQLLEKGQRAGGTMPIINKTDFSQICIPIPDLNIQREVAAILDKFDSLVNNISQGLPAEIAARRKQYEFYRDRLLSFKELRG
jgi:type I restriction enzyme S subunit